MDSADFLWCEDCKKYYSQVCNIHGRLFVIKDRPIKTKAKLTLPHPLCLKTIVGKKGEGHFYICAKKLIQSRVRFGPVVAPMVALCQGHPPFIQPDRLHLLVTKQDRSCLYLDLRDEDQCNWMMFLRLHKSHLSNSVIFQHEEHIYLATITEIKAGEEIRVKYADGYYSMVRDILPSFPFGNIETSAISSIDNEQSRSAFSVCHTLGSFKKKPPRRKRPDSNKDLQPIVPNNTIENITAGFVQTICEKLTLNDQTPVTEILNDMNSSKQSLLVSYPSHFSKKQSFREGPSKRSMKPPQNKAEETCSVCGKIFSEIHSLKRHMTGHMSKKVFICNHNGCGKSFKSNYILDRHMLLHKGEKTIKCSYCPKLFSRNDHLRSHMRIHNKNRVIQKCSICGKEYHSMLMYKAHISLHSAENGELICGICNQVFDTKSELIHHIRVHSGSRLAKTTVDRVHSCALCSKRFYASRDLKRHLVVHTPSRNFTCQICSKNFKRRDHMTRHVRLSHEKKHVTTQRQRSCKKFVTASSRSNDSSIPCATDKASVNRDTVVSVNSQQFINNGTISVLASPSDVEKFLSLTF